MVPVCMLLNSICLILFLFELERIRLLLTATDIISFSKKKEKIRTYFIMIFGSYILQTSEAIVLDYNEFKHQTILPYFTLLLLAVTSCILRVASDTYIFILFIRSIKFFLSKGMNKWKALAILILVLTIIETIFVAATKISYILIN